MFYRGILCINLILINMRYILVQETENPNNTWYYVMDDTLSNLIKIIDMDCNEVHQIPPHNLLDLNPPIPICVQP